MAESYNIRAQAARWGGRRFGAEIKFNWIQKFLISITLGIFRIIWLIMRDEFNIQRDYERWKWPQNITLGYSSLKSLEILGVHSRRAKIFAAISFPWKYDNLQILSGSRFFWGFDMLCTLHFTWNFFPEGFKFMVAFYVKFEQDFNLGI